MLILSLHADLPTIAAYLADLGYTALVPRSGDHVLATDGEGRVMVIRCAAQALAFAS